MSYPSSELINKVQIWRQKMADGTITLEEQKEAILILRQSRFAAQTASAASKSKKLKGSRAYRRGLAERTWMNPPIYHPDFSEECRECGASPCVVVEGHPSPHTQLCGTCFWHDSDMADWNLWNEQD